MAEKRKDSKGKVLKEKTADIYTDIETFQEDESLFMLQHYQNCEKKKKTYKKTNMMA